MVMTREITFVLGLHGLNDGHAHFLYTSHDQEWNW